MQKEVLEYTLGLDIGMASVGWAVLGKDRIIDLGVRAFDPGEDNDGKPHNQTRRQKRAERNRYQMRQWRLKRLLRLFKEVGLLAEAKASLLATPPRQKGKLDKNSPWALRAGAFENPEHLTPLEWARVLYHLLKYRGPEFFRKTELVPENAPESQSSNEDDVKAQTEKQGLSEGLKFTDGLLKKYRSREATQPYARTVGTLLAWLSQGKYSAGAPMPDPEDRALFLKQFQRKNAETYDEQQFHNKGKEYKHVFRREALRHELLALFDDQEKKGNPFVSLNLSASYPSLCSIPYGTRVGR